MRRIHATPLGAALVCLLVSLLTPVSAAGGAPTQDPLDERMASRARTGVVVLTIRTPPGVPGAVALRKSGKHRLASKPPSGTSVKQRIKVPAGRWSVKPQQIVDDSVLYNGTASRGRIRVRAGSSTSVKVTYRAAPAPSDLRVTRIDPTVVDLSWVAPGVEAEYAVRMASGSDAPTSVTDGSEVPVTATSATASDLAEATAYSFSVFSRQPGTTRWWGPLSTTVTTATTSVVTESAVAVTNPATVLLTDPAAVDVSVVDGDVRASVPRGTVPALGQPWVLPPSEAAPGGYVAKVVGISPDGGSVELAAAGLADAFDYVDIRVPDLGGLPVQALRPDGTLARRAARAEVECEGSGTREVTLDRSFAPYGDFHATLAKYRILGKNIPVGMSFDAEFGVDVGVTLSASVSGTATCEIDLPSLVVRIPAGPVPLVMETEPVLEATVSGEVALRGLGFTVRLGASVDGYLGLGGDDEVDGELVASASAQEPTVDAVGNVALIAGVETTVGPGFIARKRAGALIGLTANLNALDASATPTGLTCLEVTASRSASVTLDAEAWLGSWDFSRSVSVPGLDGSDAYVGSPWRVPAGCGGAAEYRIAEGTLAVDYSWASECAGDQGWCDDGDPNYTTRQNSSESSVARLEVAEPGAWVGQYDDYPAYLTAPMKFSSWDYDAKHEWLSSGYGCSGTTTYQTTGPVEFGGSYWEGGATVLAGAGTDLDVDLYDAWGDQASQEWGPYWWGSFGAWDTDYSNGYPRVPTRDSWSWGGDCEGSGQQDDYRLLEGLQPGYYYSWPEEGRRSSHDVTSTPLEGCTPQACRYRVVGTNTYEYRSSYAGSGLQGSGTATVRWSYVVERRDPASGAERPLG